MTINALSAANAYKNQLKLQQTLEDAAGGGEAGTAKSAFAQMMEDTAKTAIENQYQTEALKIDSLTGGKVDLADLVSAVSSAELTLSTVVAIRDKVISAYQDIIRMPI
jgi:flagellar hook-basal body complex protein FliE